MMNKNGKLTREGARTYSNIRRYLGGKAINRYEYKKVSEDVYQMICDAEARGETAYDVFPDGGKEFCDEVLRNCLRKKWYEVSFEILFCASTLLALFMAIAVCGVASWPEEGEGVNGVVIALCADNLIGPILGGEMGGTVGVIVNRNVFLNKRRQFLFCIIAIVAFAVLTIVSAIVLNVIFDERIFTFNWVAIVVPSAVLAVIFWILIVTVAKRNFKLKN